MPDVLPIYLAEWIHELTPAHPPCVCSGCSKRSRPKPASLVRPLCELSEKYPPRSPERITSCALRRARHRSTGCTRSSASLLILPVILLGPPNRRRSVG